MDKLVDSVRFLLWEDKLYTCDKSLVNHFPQKSNLMKAEWKDNFKDDSVNVLIPVVSKSMMLFPLIVRYTSAQR